MGLSYAEGFRCVRSKTDHIAHTPNGLPSLNIHGFEYRIPVHIVVAYLFLMV
jgi:hypothetical protein